MRDGAREADFKMMRMNRQISAVALTLTLALGLSGCLAKAEPVEPAAASERAPIDSSAVQTPLSPAQISVLRQALAQAAVHGFPAGAFTPADLDPLLRSADPGARLRGQALLKKSMLAYAVALRRGRLPLADFDDEWGMRPAPYDPAVDFEGAVAQNQLPVWLAGLPPAQAGYQQLVNGLAVYRSIASRGGWRSLPVGRVIKPGAADPRVPALRARLQAEDASVVLTSPADPAVYDPSTVGAVKVFQSRHGLLADGEVGGPTLAALNVPVEQRIAQITANMERWRWAPRTPLGARVEVNIAAAVLTLYKADVPVLSMRTVSGRATDHTPMLQSTVQSVVFNPPWNVPDSIAKKELYPKEREHPGYFEAEDIHIIKTADGERLQQAAGPKSALGLVKFDFDNRYGVYMHDTPSRGVFARQGRMVSHGCVRLEKPQELAQAILDGDGGWNAELIQSALATNDTRRAPVTKPVAVLFFYWTAFVGPDGAMNFSSDPYSWDHELLQKLAAKDEGHA
jgi:murein L,D-transpeptidase YcbB/YkuD